MKIQRMMSVLAASLLVSTAAVFMACEQPVEVEEANFAGTATKYFVAHQGGYIGEATVTTDKKGLVTSASIAEWQGPGGWAAETAGAVADGTVVRVPDPLANTTNADTAIKGYQFYIYDSTKQTWLQYNLNSAGDAFVRQSKTERDFEGTMGNPIRAEAYAKAARADTLINVTISGVTVTPGSAASVTIADHGYGHMDKANAASTYMALGASTIGYRYNTKALLAFFKANPTANYAAATFATSAITLVEDTTIDAAATVATYTATTDSVWSVADATTGATYSDFPMYATELQNAYLYATSESNSGDIRALY